MYNAETVPDLLAPDGPLAGLLAGYEDRPYQRELALEVARLLEAGGRIAVEAPTGIGKSLAYGLPAALWSAAGNGTVVVSTHTRALQEQLVHKEAPRLVRAAGGDLSVRVLKGRTNYLCRRRLEVAAAEGAGEATAKLLDRLRSWADTTATGDFAELTDLSAGDARVLTARVAGEVRFCSRSACTPATGCHFKQARARAGQAHLLVVNHALLASHLFGGYDILPEMGALVVDEAHNVIRVALDHLTRNVGPGRVASLLEEAPGRGGRTPASLLAGEGASRLAALHRAAAQVEAASRTYFGKENGRPPAADARLRYRDEEELGALCPLSPEALDHALGTLEADARSLEATLAPEGEDARASAALADVVRLGDEAQLLRRELEFLTRPDPAALDTVWWKAWAASGTFSLNAAPLEVGPSLAAVLERGPEAVIFTSATLAAGSDFSYFARETGLDSALHCVAYPSPFDFESQALVIGVRRGPDPREPGWAESVAAALADLLADPGRKTMALFTSYRDLDRVNRALDVLEEKAGEAAYARLAQGDGDTAAQLLERFRAEPRALLLGTASFWEGVDLPGDDLEVLVLTRLPFGVPTEPRFRARAERLEEAGGNPFNDLYLPEAVLRFKQGFGRLIRRRSDRGIVAVLDPRLLGKGYGRRFAGALPVPVAEAPDAAALARRAAHWWRTSARQDEGDGP
jgi:Rad3-related DNA helicase